MVEHLQKIREIIPTEIQIINSLILDIESHGLTFDFMKDHLFGYIEKYIAPKIEGERSFLYSYPKDAILLEYFGIRDGIYKLIYWYLASKLWYINEFGLVGNGLYCVELNSYVDNKQFKTYVKLIEEMKNDRYFFDFRNEVWETYQKHLNNTNLLTNYISSLPQLDFSISDEDIFANYCVQAIDSKIYNMLDKWNISKDLFHIWEDLRLGKVKETYNKQLPFNGD